MSRLTGREHEPSLARGLSLLVQQLALVESRDGLLGVVAPVVKQLVAADGVHVGLVDEPRRELKLLVDADTSATWQFRVPAEDAFVLADYPPLVGTADAVTVWRGGLGDATLARSERLLLTSLGKDFAMRVPVLLDGSVWGELFCTRAGKVEFDEHDVDLAVVVAALLAGTVARLDSGHQLRRLAYTDPLTGLANRRCTEERLDEWARNSACASSLAVILCDVNELKHVNDSLGHSTGDHLLRDMANLVEAAAGRLREGLAGRIGGDEFVIACLAEDRAQLNEVAADLTVASRAVPLGSGLSCGVAWAGDLAQLDSPPEARVSALLRLADVDQYQQKRAARAAQALATEPTASRSYVADRSGQVRSTEAHLAASSTTSPALSAHTAGDRVSALLRRQRRDQTLDILARLADVAETTSAAIGAAAWWVSSADENGVSVAARACGSPRRAGHSDGQWPEVVLDPTPFQLADYPATSAIMTGGSFTIGTHEGEPNERRLLTQTGFASMIAAGGIDQEGAGWLVEVYGDALTPDLAASRPLLEALVTVALSAGSAREP